ncbi:hypothetical protein SAMD00023353_8000220 [Rosellinia necatrix]|uniref:Uncharacterized protein n=1 Tax=Rosellinia necatrix TaxID=77044 RepID=A0A1W2TUQ3_ROSNE|nr:hypothetical protein SAMD00023353_8000220 [Rosellinia necatrix]
MRLFSLLPVSLLAALALADDEGLPPPGSPALEYTDGSFSEPNGGTASYGQGNKMNISWTSVYETTSVYLIVGYQWASPIQLTTNSAQSWFQWEVSTDSTNSTEIYVFRGVNGTGTAEQVALGGFLSAAFYIPVKETNSQTATFTTLSTSALEPSQTTTSDASSSTTSTTTTNTSVPDSGISEGTRIGIGVGVGVGVLGIGALVAAFVFWRKSKARQQSPNPQPYEMPLNGDFSPRYPNAPPYAGSPQPYAGGGQQPYNDHQPPYDSNQQALAGHYKPPEHGVTRGAELDAGQGHQFVPEAHPNNTGAARAELQ